MGILVGMERTRLARLGGCGYAIDFLHDVCYNGRIGGRDLAEMPGRYI